MLAHGQLYPGVANLDYMQYQIDHYHPDSWKGYTTAYSAKNTDDPTQPMERWRLDDEDVAYPTYELIVKNREQLATRPGFFNICIHKGLSTSDPSNPANDVPFFNADDVPKAASDWPDLNFIIYHSAWAPSFFGYPSLQDLQSGALRDGVPDIKWSTRFAQACAGHPNVYAELGSTFAATVTTFPSVWAHLIGQFLKYFGPERIVFGTDSLWYGAPQWQIEAFWRYQIPEEIATQYKYPQLTEQDKRLILGWNSARLYGLRAKAPVSLSNLYRPVPADYEAQIPSNLKASLADEPGFEEGFLLPNDGLSKLKRDYATAGGRRENLRFGWIRRA
jgi:predicted TIM-barrel fold metal-dependent hydrolase